MIKRSLLTAGLLAASISTVHALPYGFYDARSVAMGNTSVATGGTTTAALSNPGMLMVNENKDSYALLLPAIGVQVIDDGNVIDLVDEFQVLDPNNPLDVARGIQIVNELEGKSVVAAIIPNIAFVSSGENFTWGITLRADAVVSSGLKGQDDPLYNPLNPQVDALGIAITEVGIPMGTAFTVAGMQLSVGVTPRYLQIDAIEYTASLSTADLKDVKNADSQSLGNVSTFDAGVVLSLVDTFRVGFVAKNLIEDSKTTVIGRVIDIETQYRVGASFDGGFFTLAADMDLNERKPIAFENVYQSLSVGAEFNAFDTVQLRVGYQSNLASGATDPDLLSVGVGLWLGFNVDVAAVVGDDSSYGLFAQTGFHF